MLNNNTNTKYTCIASSKIMIDEKVVVVDDDDDDDNEDDKNNNNNNNNNNNKPRGDTEKNTTSTTNKDNCNGTNEKVAVLKSFDLLHEEGFSFLADNAYIHSGYRLHYSLRDCVSSLFQLHNETFNVWTHVVGSLIFVGLFVYVCFNQYKSMENFHHQRNQWPNCQPGQHFLLCGRHTLRSFSMIAFNDFNRGQCSPSSSVSSSISVSSTSVSPLLPFSTLSTQQYHAARNFLELSLSRIPSLENLHSLIEGRANKMQSSMESYVNNIRLGVHSMKREILHLQHRLHQVADADAQWTLDRVSYLKHQVEKRVEELSQYVTDAAEAVGADVSLKYALDDYDSFVNMVTNGIKAISGSQNHSELNTLHHVSRWPLFVFIASAVTCLTCSAIFHLLYVANQKVYFFLSRLDYAGIAVLIAGSFFPVIYYSFYCNPWSLIGYLTTISVLAGLTFIVSLTPAFGTPQYLIVRTAIFIALGGFGIFPLGHLMIKHGIYSDHVTVLAGNLLMMGALYILGAVIYSTRVPERFFPGRFDYIFSSHQLWHICVVVAALVHFFGAIQHYEWRWDTVCRG